ncbi:hypothetical protein HOM13_02340 [Candidatus Woesearchaeota archaeon]|jgi:hypothetical protein|nr:hypothetical protein [Candidatus Woesearchaeota archaeon]MBT5215554.1 hypothetical protein [Candidatus Woesearchaeota archaeon]MBT6402120.1 hypothetical protein [Candidatus Woesearchaeota archaeon]
MKKGSGDSNRRNSSSLTFIFVALFVMFGIFFSTPGIQDTTITGNQVGVTVSGDSLSEKWSCGCPMKGSLTFDGCSGAEKVKACLDGICKKEITSIDPITGERITSEATQSCKAYAVCEVKGKCSRERFSETFSNGYAECVRETSCPKLSEGPCENNECTFKCTEYIQPHENAAPIEYRGRMRSYSCDGS